MFRILVRSDGSYPSSLALLKSPSAILQSKEGYDGQSPSAEREALSSIRPSIPTPLKTLAGVAAIAVILLEGSPPLAGHDHIRIVTPATGTHQPVTPIRNGSLGAISSRDCGGIGLNLMSAGFTPHD
jgi:hypothetical protein